MAHKLPGVDECTSSTEFLDSMEQLWQRPHQCAFTPIALLPGVLERICHNRVYLLVFRPAWMWFSEFQSLQDGAPCETSHRPGAQYITLGWRSGNCGFGPWGGPTHDF